MDIQGGVGIISRDRSLSVRLLRSWNILCYLYIPHYINSVGYGINPPNFMHAFQVSDTEVGWYWCEQLVE